MSTNFNVSFSHHQVPKCRLIIHYSMQLRVESEFRSINNVGYMLLPFKLNGDEKHPKIDFSEKAFMYEPKQVFYDLDCDTPVSSICYDFMAGRDDPQMLLEPRKIGPIIHENMQQRFDNLDETVQERLTLVESKVEQSRVDNSKAISSLEAKVDNLCLIHQQSVGAIMHNQIVQANQLISSRMMPAPPHIPSFYPKVSEATIQSAPIVNSNPIVHERQLSTAREVRKANEDAHVELFPKSKDKNASLLAYNILDHPELTIPQKLPCPYFEKKSQSDCHVHILPKRCADYSVHVGTLHAVFHLSGCTTPISCYLVGKDDSLSDNVQNNNGVAIDLIVPKAVAVKLGVVGVMTEMIMIPFVDLNDALTIGRYCGRYGAIQRRRPKNNRALHRIMTVITGRLLNGGDIHDVMSEACDMLKHFFNNCGLHFTLPNHGEIDIQCGVIPWRNSITGTEFALPDIQIGVLEACISGCHTKGGERHGLMYGSKVQCNVYKNVCITPCGLEVAPSEYFTHPCTVRGKAMAIGSDHKNVDARTHVTKALTLPHLMYCSLCARGYRSVADAILCEVFCDLSQAIASPNTSPFGRVQQVLDKPSPPSISPNMPTSNDTFDWII